MVRKLLYIALSLILTMYYFVPNETMDKGVITLLLLLVGLSIFL
jgi:hypothetical protein